MRRYKKGDRVEVLNTTLEHSWKLARIVKGRGDVYTVLYDEHAYEMVFEVVLFKCIRPFPPLVEFSNWSRGDLVHVFHNFAWKLATVLQVLEKKQFLVRVVGSMLDLIADAAWIRVRHCWQDGRWIVVGKGPSISDERQQCIRNIISNSEDVQKKKPARATRKKITRQKSYNMSTRLIKSNAQTEARIKEAKISRTIERHSPCTLNQTDTGTGPEMRSRLTEEPQALSLYPLGASVTANETHEKQGECLMSCVGSCSLRSDSSSYQQSEKYSEHHYDGDASDAESSTGHKMEVILEERWGYRKCRRSARS